MKWGLRITVTGKYDHGPCIRRTPEFTLFLRAVLFFFPCPKFLCLEIMLVC